ncbi:MAG: hypothetical protein H8E55_20640 [Pelagibacterales bacterium]|nr:hypothetical protein [Pelagibacterales bacterium]
MDKISLELKAHYLRLFQMALIDCNFHELELQALYRMAESRGIENLELDKILLSSADMSVIPNKDEELVKYLYDLTIIIIADGKVTDDEKELFNRYATMFGFEEKNFDKILNLLLEKFEENVPRNEIYNLIKD